MGPGIVGDGDFKRMIVSISSFRIAELQEHMTLLLAILRKAADGALGPTARNGRMTCKYAFKPACFLPSPDLIHAVVELVLFGVRWCVDRGVTLVKIPVSIQPR